MSPVIGYATGDAHPENLPPFEYAWLEAPLTARLCHTAEVPHWRDLNAWPEGRLFGEAGEYRWRRRNGHLHSVLLCEDGNQLPAPFADNACALVANNAPKENGLFLWGEQAGTQDETNADSSQPYMICRTSQLPRDLHYPVAPPAGTKEAHVRLVVREYTAANGKDGRFLRCVRLVAGKTGELYK